MQPCRAKDDHGTFEFGRGSGKRKEKEVVILGWPLHTAVLHVVFCLRSMALFTLCAYFSSAADFSEHQGVCPANTESQTWL